MILQIGLGAGILLSLVLIFPQIINTSRISREVAQKQQLLADLDAGIKNFKSLESELALLEDVYDSFVKRLPVQSEFPVFLEIISRLAKKNNIKIIAIEPQKSVDSEEFFYQKIPVYVDASCSYHNLGAFLNDLEYAEKFIRVDTLEISSDPNSPDTHEVMMTLNTFCLRDRAPEVKKPDVKQKNVKPSNAKAH